MQQRRLRLGDILDDYCPRERRITNHAVVAMIEDQVKQTRCTTCDADHPYKGGKAPAPRRKKDVGALAADPVETRPRVSVAPAASADAHEPDHLTELAAAPETELEAAEVVAPADQATEPHDARDENEAAEEQAGGEDEWPVHRRLIRATLPRVEGQVPERKEPDFTMRRPTGRDGNRGGQRQQRNGHRPMRHAQGQGHSGGQPSHFGGQRHGGQGHRQGPGQGGQHQGNRPARQGGQGRGGQQPGGGPGRKRGR
jgi:hypothetical protein